MSFEWKRMAAHLKQGMAKGLRPVLACLFLALAAGGAFGASRPTDTAAHPYAPPSHVKLIPQPEGSVLVEASGYRALIGQDGNLHSLRVGETEMLDDRVAISLGSFFYADGPRELGQLAQQGSAFMDATDGTYSVQYRFLPDEIRISLENKSSRPVPYFMVLTPKVTIATHPPTGEAAAAPANEPWGEVRFATQSGAYLELSGGTRIWGPWLGRQVWEVSRIPPQGRREVRLRAGLGEPPKATLEQLVGMRAAVPDDNALVPPDEPIQLQIAIDNRSERTLDGLLSLELSASRSELVVYSSSAVALPAKQVTETGLRWEVSAPDFYQARVTVLAEGKEVATARAMAGYRVKDIEPSATRPPDFEQFWNRLLAEVGDGPPDFRMVLDESRSRRGVSVWVVQYAGIAHKTIHGWYLVPRRPGPAPAILYLSGYGARPIHPPLALARRGYAILAIDVRGNPVDRARPRPFEDYCTQGIESPDTYVYREIVAHALRAIRFLRAREEADPEQIAVLGVSEGGGLALLLSALHPDIRAVAADAPMLCDFPLSVRSAAWPYTEIARYIRRHPGAASRVARTLSYFDAVNFAPNIKCPVLLRVGLLDPVSLPAAVYGLANVLPGPAEVIPFPEAGHDVGGEELWNHKFEWLAKILGPEPLS